MKASAIAWIVGGLLAIAGSGAWWYWSHQSPPPARIDRPRATQPPAAPEPAPAAEPAVKHPLDLADTAAPAAPMTERDVEAGLSDLFGRKAALAMFQTDDFARRVAATVDNLGRSHAPSRMWPVKPADGRFVTERQGESEVIGAGNGRRYAAHVQLIEAVDPRLLFAAYLRFYPQLQKSYEELGYPGKYFNDRVVEVLDQLIATPEVDPRTRVVLPAISGPTQPQRPWVLYEFDDPDLRALSAGQRILVRTGPDNARRLKARLRELRTLAATGGPRPGPVSGQASGTSAAGAGADAR